MFSLHFFYFLKKKESNIRLAPNKSTFKELSCGLRFQLVLHRFMGKISHLKVRRFYPRDGVTLISMKLLSSEKSFSSLEKNHIFAMLNSFEIMR